MFCVYLRLYLFPIYLRSHLIDQLIYSSFLNVFIYVCIYFYCLLFSLCIFPQTYLFMCFQLEFLYEFLLHYANEGTHKRVNGLPAAPSE